MTLPPVRERRALIPEPLRAGARAVGVLDTCAGSALGGLLFVCLVRNTLTAWAALRGRRRGFVRSIRLAARLASGGEFIGAPPCIFSEYI